MQSLLTIYVMGVAATCRSCAIVGGYSDGNPIWEHSVGLHDDSAQKVKPSAEGKSPAHEY